MPHNDLKHRAKRFNERIKLVAALFNSVSVVTLGAVLINPVVNRSFDLKADGTEILLFAATLSHIVAQYALAFFQAEE